MLHRIPQKATLQLCMKKIYPSRFRTGQKISMTFLILCKKYFFFLKMVTQCTQEGRMKLHRNHKAFLNLKTTLNQRVNKKYTHAYIYSYETLLTYGYFKKSYENEVNLREQNISLKCCKPLELLIYFEKGFHIFIQVIWWSVG